jgi:hypothetical protein
MGAELAALLQTMQAGGPYVLAVILLYFWRNERDEKLALRANHEALQIKLLENTVAQVQATTKMEGAITALKDVLTQFLNKLG